MEKVWKRRTWAGIAAVVCGLSCGLTLVAHAGDPGELFPNVGTYDENVPAPISRPEKVFTPRPQTLTPTPTPIPVDPAPAPTNSKPPEVVDPPADPVKPTVDTNNPNSTVVKPKRPTRIIKKPSGTQPATATAPAPPPIPLIEMQPYATGILNPMLSAEDQKVFSAEYADTISKALSGSVEQRKKTADLLEAAAQNVQSPGLKRYILLHSFALYIRASTPLIEKSAKAEVLLPLLTERSLPVVQARADAMNDLMMTASQTPNERFLDLYIDAHALLAKLQVQAGFPKDAQDSLKKARDGSLHHMHKTPQRIDQINEAAAWCDRSTAAAALWPKFQATLKSNPSDPLTNALMATLHLSLYGNLEQAAIFAARSGRTDLKALAEVLKANPPGALSKDPKQHAEQVLAIAKALVDVAKATPVTQTFDRYSIACYAGDHVESLMNDGVVPPEKSLATRALLASAKEIVDKTNLRRGEDLPKWLGGGATTSIAASKPGATRTVGTLADVFHGLPKELQPTEIGWTNKQISGVNEWLEKGLVGQVFDGTVYFIHVRQSIDAPGGKIYVPVMFGLQFAALSDNMSVDTRIENQMSAKLAAKAKTLYEEQQVPIKGTITSVRVENFGDAHRVELRIVMTNKSD